MVCLYNHAGLIMWFIYVIGDLGYVISLSSQTLFVSMHAYQILNWWYLKSWLLSGTNHHNIMMIQVSYFWLCSLLLYIVKYLSMWFWTIYMDGMQYPCTTSQSRCGCKCKSRMFNLFLVQLKKQNLLMFYALYLSFCIWAYTLVQ